MLALAWKAMRWRSSLMRSASWASVSLRAGRLALGDVPHHQKKAGNSLDLNLRPRYQNPEAAPALSGEQKLHIPDRGLLPQPLDQPLPVRKIRPYLQLQRGVPNHLLALVAEHMQEGLIHIDEPPILQVADGDGVDAGLKGGAIERFAVLQLHLPTPVPGNIPDDAAHLAGIALVIHLQLAQSMHPALAPIPLPQDAVLLVEGLSLPNNLFGKVGRHHRAVIGMDQRLPAGYGALIFRIDAEDLIQNAGAAPDSGGDIHHIAAQVSDPLRLGEKISTLVQRLRRLSPNGDVVGNRGDARHHSRRIADQREGQCHVNSASVLPPEHRIEEAGGASCGDLQQSLLDGFLMAGRSKNLHALAQNLLTRIAGQPFRSRIPTGNAPIQIHCMDQVCGGIDDRGQQGAAPPRPAAARSRPPCAR